MRIARLFSGPVLCLLIGYSLLMPAASPVRAADWNVAVIDQLLAGVAPGQQTVQVGDMEILVTNLRAWRNQLAGGPHPEFTFNGTTPLWTGGNIYYAFSNNVSAIKQRAFVDGANEWATFANVHFIPWTTQANYVVVGENPTLNGGQSGVGMIGGQQSLQLGTNAWNRATICHELGHTLGLIHEHQRSDRDTNVMVFTNNIIPGYEADFAKLTTSQNIGPYDFYSVMHYGTNSFSIDPTNLNTLLPQPAFSQFTGIMGVRNDPVLSALDRAGMATNYGAGPTLTSVVTNTLDSGAGSLRAALYYAFDHPGTTITFNIPTTDPGFSNGVFNVSLTDGLPSLVNATVLDATTEPTNSNPNGPEIFLNGVLARQLPVYPNGLRFRGTNCTARGFVIGGFPAAGVLMDGATTVSNSLAGCYVGVSANGTMPFANGLPSVTISGGSSANIIGGTNAAQRNVIGGSPYQGLIIQDSGTRGNVVLGNYIGVNAAGAAALSNTWAGIEISGGAQANTIGGTVTGARNVISGNGLQGIANSGTNSGGNVIVGNYIGLAAAGTTAVPNGFSGIEIFNGPSSNRVGGFTVAERNVISGNGRHGVSIGSPTARGNVVVGNYIGLNATGTAAVSNGWAGVQITDSAQGNVVGGSSVGASNVISGNNLQGVVITGINADGNVIAGNYIGVGASGATVVSNGLAGIEISGGASSNRVGGFAVAERNVISGNGRQGILISGTVARSNMVVGNYVGLNAAGTAALSNGLAGVEISGGAQGSVIGGTTGGAGNVISGNGRQGVAVWGLNTATTYIQGNVLGLDPTGTSAIGNTWSGVEIFGTARGTIVGGTAAGAGNIVSGNLIHGVLISDAGTSNNIVQGNLIGLDASGLAKGNGQIGAGIVNGASSNLIGGTDVAARNVISGNGHQGVAVANPGTRGNVVSGNYIGVNPAGDAGRGNTWAGVNLYNAPDSNIIGGTAPGAGNVISGNALQGVLLQDAGTRNNSVQGNLIGLNAAGTAALANAGSGVEIYNGPAANVIGGAGGARNFISGNGNYGVLIDFGSGANLIQGNTIGLNISNSTAVPNGYSGVALYGGAVSNQIGGLGFGAANLISGNAADGVTMFDAGTTNNSVRGNSIVSNAGYGLALYTGANLATAVPALSNAVLGVGTVVRGALTNNLPSTIFQIDYYANPPGTAQAMTYLGAFSVTTGAGGTVIFTNTLAAIVPAGRVVTATATDPAGNTSGLSLGITVATTSTVNDGIPDAWRAAMFGGSGTTTNGINCATCDPDGDGMNNLAEFLSGTNPTNAASVFKLTALNPGGSGLVAVLPSVAGINYRVEARDDIAAGAWRLLVDQIIGSGGPVVIGDTNATVMPKRFYRAGVQW